MQKITKSQVGEVMNDFVLFSKILNTFAAKIDIPEHMINLSEEYYAAFK